MTRIPRPGRDPRHARLDEIHRDAERAVEGMRRAARDREPTMFGLHQRDAARLLAEAERLLAESGSTLLRQINGLVRFGVLVLALASAVAAKWRFRDPVLDVLAAGILAVLLTAVVLRRRFLRELERERDRRR